MLSEKINIKLCEKYIENKFYSYNFRDLNIYDVGIEPNRIVVSFLFMYDRVIDNKIKVSKFDHYIILENNELEKYQLELRKKKIESL
ncbi:hypothetical protein M0Q50_05405 [bacterium]|jgi:hypothetical protein|nr:hypothetical protein [bacterium]